MKIKYTIHGNDWSESIISVAGSDFVRYWLYWYELDCDARGIEDWASASDVNFQSAKNEHGEWLTAEKINEPDADALIKELEK